MSKREDQAFEAWCEEVEATLGSDEEITAFRQFSASDAGRDVFRGTLREKDYYTKLNNLNSEKEELEKAQEELTEWWEQEEPIRAALVKERDELKAKADTGDPGGPPNQVAGISPEEFAMIRAKAQKADAIDKILPKVLGDYGAVLQDAMKNGYEIDPREIMATSVSRGIDPYRAYDMLTADQRRTRANEAHKQEQEKWFEEGRRAALSGDAPDHVTAGAGPSIYDRLTAELPAGVEEASVPLTKQARINEAVKQYRDGDY